MAKGARDRYEFETISPRQLAAAEKALGFETHTAFRKFLRIGSRTYSRYSADGSTIPPSIEDFLRITMALNLSPGDIEAIRKRSFASLTDGYKPRSRKAA